MRIHVGHLVMGLVFLVSAGLWALLSTDVVTDDDLHWLIPLPFLVAGTVGLGVVAWQALRR